VEPLNALEDALHLLRRAGARALCVHLAGSAPLALAVLHFWTDIANPRTAHATLIADSLALALLLAWMNGWRAAFAGILRHELAGSPAPAWTAGRLWRLAAGQAFLGATRLAAEPLALAILFPFAHTAAFYRYAAVLAGSEDRDPLEAMAQARRLAGRDPGGWQVPPLLLLLWLLVFLNLAMVLTLLPQLVRMFTGHESAFSRSGIHFVANPLFWLVAVAAAWVAFDPFVQAVYAVLCFHAESRETGEDILAGLRRIGAPPARLRTALIVGALALLAAGRPAAAQVSRTELQESIRQAMQSPEYDWRLPPEARPPANPSWLVASTDRVLARLAALGERLGDAFSRFLKWLAERLSLGLPEGGGGAAPAAGLKGSIWAGIAAALLVLAFWLWRGRGRRRRRSSAPVAGAAPLRADIGALSAADLPEERWLELAERSAREGNPRLAVRAFYLASLAWLGQREFLALHRGKTNREYQAELRRRTRGTPAAARLFAANTAAFERAWYGMHKASAVDAAELRARCLEMQALLAPAREPAA
jgi:hypothetical protein